MAVDLSPADVIALYLSDSVNAKLAPKLRNELRSGTRWCRSITLSLGGHHIRIRM